MPILSRRTVAALAVSFGLLGVFNAAVPGRAAADNINVLQALHAGGIVIVVRHGATFPDQADTDPLNFDNIAAQRNLNDKGKALAKAFGDALRQSGVPIGKVYTSKYNRAYETAVIAGFKNIEKTADITEGGLVVSPDENSSSREAADIRSPIRSPRQRGRAVPATQRDRALSPSEFYSRSVFAIP